MIDPRTLRALLALLTLTAVVAGCPPPPSPGAKVLTFAAPFGFPSDTTMQEFPFGAFAPSRPCTLAEGEARCAFTSGVASSFEFRFNAPRGWICLGARGGYTGGAITVTTGNVPGAGVVSHSVRGPLGEGPARIDLICGNHVLNFRAPFPLAEAGVVYRNQPTGGSALLVDCAPVDDGRVACPSRYNNGVWFFELTAPPGWTCTGATGGYAGDLHFERAPGPDAQRYRVNGFLGAGEATVELTCSGPPLDAGVPADVPPAIDAGLLCEGLLAQGYRATTSMGAPVPRAFGEVIAAGPGPAAAVSLQFPQAVVVGLEPGAEGLVRLVREAPDRVQIVNIAAGINAPRRASVLVSYAEMGAGCVGRVPVDVLPAPVGGPDAGVDVPPTGSDGGVDVVAEAAVDAGVDAAPDVVVDAGPVPCPTATAVSLQRVLGSGRGVETGRVLAVGGGYVAWADGASLYLTHGDSIGPALTLDGGAVTAIAIEGDSLFWVVTNTSTGVGVLKRRLLAPTGFVAPTVIPLPVRGVSALVVTADRYHWIDEYELRVRTATREETPVEATLAVLPAGYRYRGLRLSDGRLYWERYRSSGASCYGLDSVDAAPRAGGALHTTRSEYLSPVGTTCSAVTFTGFDLDATGLVFHDPSGPRLRATPPLIDVGSGRGDGTAVALWRGCVIAYNGSGYTAVERVALGRSRALPSMSAGGLFDVEGDTLFAIVGTGLTFSVIRLDL